MVQLGRALLGLALFQFSSALTVPQQILEDDTSLAEYNDSDLIVNATEVDTYNFGGSDLRTCDNWDPSSWDYDVAIVGGGPAGLAASMSLGRVARTSLMYDSEEYRNGKTRYMHDVLGQDGQSTLFLHPKQATNNYQARFP